MTDLFITLAVLIGGYYLSNRVIKPYILDPAKEREALANKENKTEDIDYEEVE